MTFKPKTVTITKEALVVDAESLAAWLDHEMADWLKNKRDGGANKATAGRKALELIREAGFTLEPPRLTR